jgi:hypothetical protein
MLPSSLRARKYQPYFCSQTIENAFQDQFVSFTHTSENNEQCAIFNLGNATAMENGYEIHPVQKKSKDAGVTGVCFSLNRFLDVYKGALNVILRSTYWIYTNKLFCLLGFNNQAFAPVTPTAPPPEACNGRFPSRHSACFEQFRTDIQYK